MTDKKINLVRLLIGLSFNLMIVMGLGLSLAQAGIIYVNPDSTGVPQNGSTWDQGYHTITDALTMASPLDEIWVKAGIYLEAITLLSDVKVLGGFDGTETIADGRNWILNETVIDGNGAVHTVIGATSARLDGFTITGGDAAGSIGGGVYCNATSPLIINCRIKGNSAPAGGGVGVSAWGAPRFVNCIITDNWVTNMTAEGGGGIYAIQSNPDFINCTIVGNDGSNFGGGGLSLTIDATVDLYNCILWDNTAGDPSKKEIYNLQPATATAEVHYCDVDQAGYEGTNGNIRSDPVFVGDDTYFHIQSASPCREAGTAAVPGSLPTTDIDGDPREVGVVDIGADEYYQQLSPGEYYVDIVSGSDLNDGSEGTPWKTLHYAISKINDGSAGNYTLHVAAGIYTVGNGETDETLAVERDNLNLIGAGAGSTILDGTGNTNWLEGLIIYADGVVVRDLTVRRFKTSGIRISDGDQNELTALTIYDNGNPAAPGQGSGVIIEKGEGPADENLVYGNDIYWSGDLGHTQYYGVRVNPSAGTDNAIYRNQIHGHSASFNFQGVYVKDSNPNITDNDIYDNCVGIYIWGDAYPAEPAIANNLIYDTGDNMTYGIYINSPSAVSTPPIYHNTIVGGGTDETGVYCSGSGAQPDIKYNIIADWGEYGLYNTLGAPTVDYNCLWDNALGHYSGLAGGPHDLISDPQLANDYRLQAGSPCIDAIPGNAGDPIIVDKDGLTRPQGTGFDMGCYEYSAFVLRVQVSPEGGGRVTGTGIDCPGDCIEGFASATQVTLTADPSSGYRFYQWEGDLTGTTNPSTINVNGDKSVTAVFADESAQVHQVDLNFPAGTTAAHYRIFSIPLTPLDPNPSAIFGPQIGTYDTSLYRIGYWDPDTQSYREYPFPETAKPGDAGWLLARNGLNLTFRGYTTSTIIGPAGLEGYRYPITSGWNQIGNPYQFSVSVSGLIVEEENGSYAYLTDPSNTITQRVFWVYPNGQYSAATRLQVGQGGWIKKLTPGGGNLFFPVQAAVPDIGPAAYEADANVEQPPAPPDGLVDQSSAPGGSSGGGGGGCFIQTVIDQPNQ